MNNYPRTGKLQQTNSGKNCPGCNDHKQPTRTGLGKLQQTNSGKTDWDLMIIGIHQDLNQLWQKLTRIL
jgi:hypothetical protein